MQIAILLVIVSVVILGTAVGLVWASRLLEPKPGNGSGSLDDEVSAIQVEADDESRHRAS